MVAAMASALAWVPWAYRPAQASTITNVLAAWLLLVALGFVAFCLMLGMEAFKGGGRARRSVMPPSRRSG